MKTATFQYRCRMCGTVYNGGQTSEKNASTFLIEALQEGVSGCNKSIPLTLTDLHFHSYGSTGVADIIGFDVSDD